MGSPDGQLCCRRVRAGSRSIYRYATQCIIGPTNYGPYTIFSNFSYIDNHGTRHTFPQNLQVATLVQGSGIQCTNFFPNPGWGTNMSAGTADDGSSYFLFLTGGNGAPGAYVLDAHDIENDSIDLNGNTNTLNNDPNFPVYTHQTLVDSSGNTALTIVKGSPSHNIFLCSRRRHFQELLHHSLYSYPDRGDQLSQCPQPFIRIPGCRQQD